MHKEICKYIPCKNPPKVIFKIQMKSPQMQVYLHIDSEWELNQLASKIIYKISIRLLPGCPLPSTGDAANHSVLWNSMEFRALNALATFLLQGFQKSHCCHLKKTKSLRLLVGKILLYHALILNILIITSNYKFI